MTAAATTTATRAKTRAQVQQSEEISTEAAIESATAKLKKQQSKNKLEQQQNGGGAETRVEESGLLLSKATMSRNLHVKFLVQYARTSKELRESINDCYETIEARFQRLIDESPFRNILRVVNE